MLSVERYLLQSALNAVEYLALRGDDIGLSNEPVAKELRALLDKEVDGDSHAPKKQGEPVAELQVAFFEHGPMATINWFTPSAFESGATKLYAEQPAPVAVVMPERMHIPAANCPERINAQGWNACLDAYARLNGVKP